MANKEVYTFASADGVSTIHAVRWTPEDGQIRAVLQVTHGMVEFIERYEPLAEFLTGKGFAVFGHDHIGHGESVRNESEWGIMHAEHPSDVMVEDMFMDYNLGRNTWPGLPFFMLGHSMGSYMLRKVLSVKGSQLEGVKGAIIMGTGTEADGTLKMGMNVLKLIARFKGWDYRSKMVAGMMFGKPYKQFNLDGSDPANSWLSKNVENVKWYYQEPKCTFMFSLGAYRGLVEACIFDNDQDNIANVPKDLPIFFVSGQDDPVGGLGAGVEAAYKKFKSAGIKDVQMKLYKNDRHEILNEPDHQIVFDDLLNWMSERF